MSHPKIGNLDSLKRAFSNKEYDDFKRLLEETPYKYYKGKYKDSSEFKGRPDFVIQNRNKGFIQSEELESKRAYLFVAFHCFKDDELHFESYWIVNTEDSLESLLGEDHSSFDFTPVSTDEIHLGFQLNGGVAHNYLH